MIIKENIDMAKPFAFNLLFMLAWIGSKSFAQIPDSLLDYYPYQNGNKWEYKDLTKAADWNYGYHFEEVIGDSCCNDGNVYKKIKVTTPVQPGLIINEKWQNETIAFKLFRIDTTNTNVYLLMQNRIERIDSLGAKVGDRMGDECRQHQTCFKLDPYIPMLIFSKYITIRHIKGPYDYEQQIVKNLGIVYYSRFLSSTGYSYTLRGAIIGNDTLGWPKRYAPSDVSCNSASLNFNSQDSILSLTLKNAGPGYTIIDSILVNRRERLRLFAGDFRKLPQKYYQYLAGPYTIAPQNQISIQIEHKNFAENCQDTLRILSHCYSGKSLSTISIPLTYTAYSSKVNNFKASAFSFYLNQNYPNPFNPNTVILYALPASGLVEFNLYNVLGQRVQTFSIYQYSGTHTFDLSAENLASGVYVYEIKFSGQTLRKKLVVQK
jgi:hypothetical protein